MISYKALTPRHLEILALLGQGLDNHAIANQLRPMISHKTVEQHFQDMQIILNEPSVRRLTVYAARYSFRKVAVALGLPADAAPSQILGAVVALKAWMERLAELQEEFLGQRAPLVSQVGGIHG